MFEKISNCCYYYIYYSQKELGFSIHFFNKKKQLIDFSDILIKKIIIKNEFK